VREFVERAAAEMEMRTNGAGAAFAALALNCSAFVPNNLGHLPKFLEIDCITFRNSRE
jgi:hypothetical protein